MKRPEGLPEPGLHEGVPFADYLKWPAANNSGLGTMLKRTPAHYKSDLEKEPEESTDAQLVGKATHAVVLEQEMYGETYRAAGQCSFITGKNEPCKSQGRFLLKDGRSACGAHVKQVGPVKIATGVEVLTPKQAKVVNGCSNAVSKHPAASALLRSEGPMEVSIVWQDPETGVWCKGRIDKLSLEFRSTLDYKTTEDASEDAFERSVYKFGYHRQGAFYLRGTDALSVGIDQHVLVAQEKAPPFAVATYGYPRGGGTMMAGDEYFGPLLKIYAQCQKDDTWPAYGDEIKEGHLPHYAWAQMDAELERLRERIRKGGDHDG